MTNGTAKITKITAREGDYFQVEWANHGNFLSNEPRLFTTEQAARAFCIERNLRIAPLRDATRDHRD